MKHYKYWQNQRNRLRQAIFALGAACFVMSVNSDYAI
jgi:hypothetical protein